MARLGFFSASNYISEGSVSHINGVWPSFSNSTALGHTKFFSGCTWHQLVRTCTSPYKYQTRYCIFDLFLSSPCAWLQRCFFFKFTDYRIRSTGHGLLTNRYIEEIQESMRTLREDVNRLKGSGSEPPSREQYTTMPRNNDQDPAQRIPGTSWAEEMDILDLS